MKRVYYKGQPYEFTTIGNNIGKRHFQLYRNNILMHTVQEQDLDKKSVVSIILDAYYNGQPSPVMAGI